MAHHTNGDEDAQVLAAPLDLPCGVRLRNRLVKAAMSDSLGHGGKPTSDQIELYRRWAAGGTALAVIGEVQVDHRYPERPGNLVLGPNADEQLLSRLAAAGSIEGAQIWPQLGHGGALAFAPLSEPAGPSPLGVEGLECVGLSTAEVDALPHSYAEAAQRARSAGFSGVQIHAGHGFLLSQFLSPLFNHRSDRYGGSIEARSQLLLDVVRDVREAIGPDMAISVRINSSDQLSGGLSEDDALVAIDLLGTAGVDLIDISGGTYFPGAPASSDRRSAGPYFVDFARRARMVTTVPLMVTGGFKTRAEAADAIASGAVDAVGLARTMVLDPDLPTRWLSAQGGDPEFPSFDSPPEGGVTAWFTMRITALARGDESAFDLTVSQALEEFEARDADRTDDWLRAFAGDL